MSTAASHNEAQKPSLEDRLMPKLEDAEYLLVLVLALMLWTAGFVDLFTHTSQTKTILGLYSLPYFLFLIVYSLGFIFWGWLIFPTNSIDNFKTGLKMIQTRTWLGLLVFLGMTAYLTSMYLFERWVSYPLLQASSAILVLLFAGVILWSKPDGKPITQRWRIILGWLVIVLILMEGALQGASLLRVLPLKNTNGMFTPYGRVYQNSEGFTNTKTNRLGWYYPDFKFGKDSNRIIFTGDSYLQGIQVAPEENLGFRVQEKLAQGSSLSPAKENEVIAMGLPGYGPGLYLDRLLIPYTIRPVQAAEVVVFFHLANDFQVRNSPGGETPTYVLDENGEIALHPNDFVLRHDLQHTIIRGYEPINPVRIASSHLFLFNLFDDSLRGLLNERQHVPMPALNTSRASPEMPFGAASFVFTDTPEGLHSKKIALGLLSDFHQAMKAEGISVRLVTIPYFPQEFFEQNQGADWSSQLGAYDILLPDQALKEFSAQNEIPFLSLGEYFLKSGKTVQEIQTYFYRNGTGHFTSAGHGAAAQAVYDCFYRADFSCPVP